MWTYMPCMDRTFLLTGVYSGGTTTWTVPIKDATLDRIILGPDFGDSAGVEFNPTSVTISGTTTLVTKSGNYSAGAVAIGRLWTSSIKLAPPQLRDGSGFAITGVRLDLEEITITFQDLGSMNLRRRYRDSPTTTQVIYNQQIGTVERGRVRLFVNGDMDDMELFLDSESPRPFTITSIEYLVQATNRDD